MDLTQVRTLAECEAVIERGLTTFVEVGEALLEIRDQRLYREHFATFEDYCRERWGFSKTHANRLVEASETVRALTPIGVKPTTESQARELAPLRHEPERMAEAWHEAVEVSNGSPTAEVVRETVDRVRERLEPIWDASQAERRQQLEDGLAVTVNQRSDTALIQWAVERGLLVRVDRSSVWGNPFLLDEDGDRLTVIAKYRDYFLPHKDSLLRRLDELQGKALACWCSPEPCHGDVLCVEVNGERGL